MNLKVILEMVTDMPQQWLKFRFCLLQMMTSLTVEIRALSGSRILRVLLVSVPTCNRSLINHNRRVWQIKRIRSRRIIFHGDHQI